MQLLIRDALERASVSAAPLTIVGHARGGKLVALDHRVIDGGVGVRAGGQMQLAIVQRPGQRAAACGGNGFADLLELQVVQSAGGRAKLPIAGQVSLGQGSALGAEAQRARNHRR